jgi:HrpA-like RNA helicase
VNYPSEHSFSPEKTNPAGNPSPEIAEPFDDIDLEQVSFSVTDAFDKRDPSAGIEPDTLPVRLAQRELEELLIHHDIVVLTSETGSGKTTQVPQIMAEKGLSVLVTQPRRVTTKAAAERVAAEMEVPLGSTVGFAHGLERSYGHDTEVMFCTDGYELVRELSRSRNAFAFDVLILDEIHEMNSNMIVLLALAREHVQENPGKKLIIMSATMNAETLASYMGDAPILNVPGRTFSVSVDEPKSSMETDIMERVHAGEEVLVFLPGKREIEAMETSLRRMAVPGSILPFHSELPSEALKKAFIKGDRPRVILATNIAQTGLTMSVDTVIDSGLERSISQILSTDALDVSEVSQFDIAQRMGRVGRDKPGTYIYYGATPIESLQTEPTPDLLRTSINQLTLRLIEAGRPIEKMQLLFQPSESQIEDSYQTLLGLGLVTKRGKDYSMTQLGRQVVRLPVDVRAGIMVVQAMQREADFPGITREVIDIVSVLETRSLTDPRMEKDWKKLVNGESRSDLLAQVAIFHAAEGKDYWWCQNHGVKMRQVERAVATRQMLLDRLDLPENAASPKPIAPNFWEDAYRRQVLECVWHGLVDSAFKHVREGWTNGEGIRQLPRDSVIKEGRLVVGVPFGIGTGSTPEESSMRHLLFLASEIDPRWYREHTASLPSGKQDLAYGLSAQAYEDRKSHDEDGQRSWRRNGKHGGRHEDYSSRRHR